MWIPASYGWESAGSVAASAQLMALCPCLMAGGKGGSLVPGWKSLPFAAQMSHWLYSDGHFYLLVYFPDPPGGMSSSAVAGVLLRPIEVVVNVWTTLLRVWRAKKPEK